jgi:hypothetical protein
MRSGLAGLPQSTVVCLLDLVPEDNKTLKGWSTLWLSEGHAEKILEEQYRDLAISQKILLIHAQSGSVVIKLIADAVVVSMSASSIPVKRLPTCFQTKLTRPGKLFSMASTSLRGALIRDLEVGSDRKTRIEVSTELSMPMNAIRRSNAVSKWTCESAWRISSMAPDAQVCSIVGRKA